MVQGCTGHGGPRTSGAIADPRWRAASIAALVVLAVSASLARQDTPSGEQQDPPVFRAEIRYVEVDVFVTDRDGAFVRDLTADDFELFEDGERQEVSTFALVDLPIVSRSASPAAAGTVDADVTTNEEQGRLYVMLLDAAAGADASYTVLTQRLARRFVEESMAPGDRMVVLHAQGSQGSAQSFTHDRRLLLDAIDRFGPASFQDAVGPEDRVRMMLNSYAAIEDLSERLGVVTGRRKAILWIGGRVPFEGRDPAYQPAPGTNPAFATEEALIQFGYRDAIRAATRNNVAIYPIDPRGLTTTLGAAEQLRSPELEQLAALRSFAEDTGGIAVVNTNDFAAGYDRIVRDNSTYYLLGYYPTVDRRDGRFRPIAVRVSRPGLTVRARPGYFARDPDAEASRLPPLPEGLSAPARDALRSPAPVTGIAIDLLATSFRGTDGSAVLIGAQVRGRDLALEPGERLEFAYQALTPEGRVAAGAHKAFTLTFEPESRRLVEGDGLRFFDRLELPAGRYEVRFVAHQPGGSTGSVIAHVEVPDFSRGPLALSGIVLTSASTSSHRTLFGDPQMADVVPDDAAADALVALPTPVRRFPRHDTLGIIAEVYVNVETADRTVRLRTVIATADGAEVFTTEQELAGGPGADRVAHVGVVPLDGFEPGRYALTLEAQSPAMRTPVGRQVPFEIVSGPEPLPDER